MSDTMPFTAAPPPPHDAQNCERDELPNVADEDPVWEATAHSLAGLCASLVLVVSPERIVLSGGVMNRKVLYAKVGMQALADVCLCVCVRFK